MSMRAFILMIAVTVKRLEFTCCPSHHQMFVDLAPVFISAQDRGLPPDSTQLLTPYRGIIARYAGELASSLEATNGKLGRTRLPLGMRSGKLHFSPVLQLAKLAAVDELKSVKFEALPRTVVEIGQNLRGRIALGKYAGEPAAFNTVLGFTLASYCGFLGTLRRTDPVLFAMLMANELEYARDWAVAHRPEAMMWVDRAAALAELERLAQIVSFLRDHHLRIGVLKKALRGLSGRNAASQRALLNKRPETIRHVSQLGYSTEALRALFLGDAGQPALSELVDWSKTTPMMRWKAAGRSAWFAKNETLQIAGFRSAKRFIRGRRASAYTYYGIPLDSLLVVGIKDLSNSLGRLGGIHAIDELASAIHEGLFGNMVGFDLLARQASTYSEIYLRALGHGGGRHSLFTCPMVRKQKRRGALRTTLADARGPDQPDNDDQRAPSNPHGSGRFAAIDRALLAKCFIAFSRGRQRGRRTACLRADAHFNGPHLCCSRRPSAV